MAVLGSASPASADPECNPGGAYLLWLRGSGQQFDDVEAQRFKEHVRYAMNAIGVSTPTTSWAEIGNLDGNYTLETEAPRNEYPAVAAPWNAISWIYGPSVEKGTNELIAHLNDRYAGDGPTNSGACKNEIAVIGAYSQGADAAGWALQRTGYGSLSSQARDHIGYVGLYGDSTNNYGCGLDRWWQRGINENGCGHSGIVGARSPYAPSEFRGRLGSWCDTYDMICTSGSPTGSVVGNHVTIYRDHWIRQSAAEIAKAANNRLALLNPSQGTGVGTATYRGSDALTVNQPMYKNQYIMSSGGNFALVLQSDGNLVLYGHRYQPLWSSGTSGQKVSHVVLQPDGNLVMYSPGGQPVWHLTTSAGASHVTVQPDGNMVQYNTSGQAVWHTNTGRVVAPTVYVGQDHLSVNQYLTHNQYIRSADGTRFLHLQADGNLVLYGPGRHLLWHSGTAGTGATHVVMQPDGNLVLYGPTGQPVWFTGQSANASHVTVQPDGNVAQYNTSGQAVWWSGTAGLI